jgi:broad specificity phosphatase PhoE
MILGLARHFQIPHNKVSLLDGEAFDRWSEWYDTTEVNAREVPKAGDGWEKCYCSDLPRAMFTANWLYRGPIETTPLLREVPYHGFLPRNLRFPLFMWTSMSRVGWFFDRNSQEENRTQTMKRIAAFLELLESRHRKGQRILIVSHGFLMQYMEKELVKKGFRGQVPVRPRGGIIYPFES